MLASVLASVLIVTSIFSTLEIRRRERRRDSITRFADARRAMSVTQGRPAVRTPKVTPQPSEPGSKPPSVVVHSGSAKLLDPTARRSLDQGRKSFRRDPDVLARRPTVAMLPTLLTARVDADVHPLPSASETDARTTMVPLPMPESEAS